MAPAVRRARISLRFSLRWLAIFVTVPCILLSIYRVNPPLGIVAALIVGPLLASITAEFVLEFSTSGAAVIGWLSAIAMTGGYVGWSRFFAGSDFVGGIFAAAFGSLLGSGVGILVMFAHFIVAATFGHRD